MCARLDIFPPPAFAEFHRNSANAVGNLSSARPTFCSAAFNNNKNFTGTDSQESISKGAPPYLLVYAPLSVVLLLTDTFTPHIYIHKRPTGATPSSL